MEPTIDQEILYEEYKEENSIPSIEEDDEEDDEDISYPITDEDWMEEKIDCTIKYNHYKNKYGDEYV